MKKLLFLIPIIFSCSIDEPATLFEEVAEPAGIDFNNELAYTEEFNPYTYRNFYNGGGVALGDVNNDGLLDIYFTGNLVDNKLYLNKGNWKFEDITKTAGVSCSNIWSSGASFADVDGDGWLDLYVCKSGKPEGENRHNELFINNGDNTFTERSKDFNLDITGLSTHAAFFDFDKDGDLDCYVLTNSIRSIGVGSDLIEDQREIPDPNNGGNKLLRNDDGVFKDITIEAGIYTSTIGYGLGITLSDFNGDTWPDIFVSNDFFERDYLYINNKQGGFKEELENYFESLSMGSMGADVGDLDNDGNFDLMVTEMLPATIERRRTKAAFESWDKYQLSVSKGYFHQFPRNVLQRNIGQNQFLEVGRFSGVSATEWSWGALIFDMNNDGLKDIFVSNGVYKDLLDRDYLTYMANDEQVRNILKKNGSVVKDLVDIIPSSPVVNAAFVNQGEFKFENRSEEWGLGTPSFSNGSAFGDLDNDGDQDLVINNVNMPSFVYRNNTDTSQARSLRIKLTGREGNSHAIGARLEAVSDGNTWSTENFTFRGFQSSIDPTVHMGVGDLKMVDTLKIYWPLGGITVATGLQTNTLHSFTEPTNLSENDFSTGVSRKLNIRNVSSEFLLDFNHRENNFIDFDRERLLPEMYSNEGPFISTGDLNADGAEDFFVGGAKEGLSKLFLSEKSGYEPLTEAAWDRDKISEDMQSTLFDCDGDGDLDLYVSSGGRAFSKSSSALADRLYLNNGNNTFTKTTDRLPAEFFSSSTVAAADYDLDGDIDLFVGERFHPFYYGQDGGGYLLENDGNGYFKETVDTFQGLGMITDATWVDVNQDNRPDLVVVGDWMPIKVFTNQQGSFVDESGKYGLSNTHGWWKCIRFFDADNDGDQDFIAGNHGTNSFLKSGVRMYRSDFDKNGTAEQIICEKRDGKYYPIADRNELIAQLPILKKKLLHFSDFATMSMKDIFSEEEIAAAQIFDTELMETTLFLNQNSVFQKAFLPNEAQYSPTFAIESFDLNKDGFQDLILGGNQYLVKPQFGRYDASKGLILLGTEAGFTKEGVVFLDIDGQVRDIKMMKFKDRNLLLFAINNDPLQVYEVD